MRRRRDRATPLHRAGFQNRYREYILEFAMPSSPLPAPADDERTTAASPSSDMPARRAEPFAEVTEEAIACLIDTFYGRVRHDPRLGPIFDGHIADQWPRHLATMRAFWSSVMLGSRRYSGNPVMTHAGISELQPDDFRRWLAVFGATCDELCTPDVAAAFRDRAERIAQSLQFALFYRPRADDPRLRA
jgi:hemoglobin